jgi:hypothetical protein
MNRKMWTALTLAATTAALAACSMFDNTYPEKHLGSDRNVLGNDPHPSTLSEILGTGSSSDRQERKASAEVAASLAVNAYLWRASLDTLSFMPLASADPFGGVIITDWYSPAETPTERFKMSVYIMDRMLRADALHVSVFHQTQTAAGVWTDTPVEAKTAVDVENVILARAREMRTANAAAQKN